MVSKKWQIGNMKNYNSIILKVINIKSKFTFVNLDCRKMSESDIAALYSETERAAKVMKMRPVMFSFVTFRVDKLFLTNNIFFYLFLLYLKQLIT